MDVTDLSQQAMLFIAWAWIPVFTLGLGAWIARHCGLVSKDRELLAADLGGSLLIGTCSLSIALTPLYVLGSLTRSTAVGTLVVLIIPALLGLQSIHGYVRTLIVDSVKRKSALWLFLFILLIPHLVGIVTAPVLWDELAYHLPLMEEPYKMDFSAGLYSAIPFGLDVLYRFGMAVSRNYIVAKMFHWMHFAALLLIGCAYVKKFYGRGAAWCAAYLIVLSPLSLIYAPSCYVDFGTAAYEVLLAFSIVSWWRTREAVFLKWAAFACGGALSIKYIPLPFVALCICLVGAEWFLQRKKIAIQASRWFWPQIGLLIVIPCGFWYIKNWIVYGNPLWPFLFGHEGMTEEIYKGLTVDLMRDFSVPKTLTNFILMPLRILSGSFEVFSGEIEWRWDSVQLGALGAVIAPIVAWRKKDKNLLGLVLLYWGYFSMNFWQSSHQIRFVIGAVMLGFFILISTLQYIERAGLRSALSVLLIGFTLWQMPKDVRWRLDVLFGKMTMQSYLTRFIHDFPLSHWAHKHSISGSESGYTFEILSGRFISNYSLMGRGVNEEWESELTDSEQYQRLYRTMQARGIRYWFISDQTSGYRRGWASTPHYPDEAKADIHQQLRWEELILRFGTVLESDGKNYLVRF